MGVAVPLGGRAFEILAALAQADGALISKEELTGKVWRGIFVEESALRVHIAAIRKALGPDRDMLGTTVGRGYRLKGTWRIRHVPALLEEAARTEARPATNLPLATFTLVGRDSAVAHLLHLISAYRVVTLVGPGGIGKTSLALATARLHVQAAQADGFVVELAYVSDGGLVASSVARVLGIKLEGEDISSDTVARAIGTRSLLLLLDNCEHLIDAVAQFAETVISRCSATTILATSREALRIDGEQLYRVPPLITPVDRTPDKNSTSEHSAIELFMMRAQALGSNFERDDANMGAVAAICRRLDGIPLAIEFAAAHSATLDPSKIAALLDDRFEFLTLGRRTALPRQQTLRATLDWSYDLLSGDEARLFRHLGIFAGHFAIQSVFAVVEDRSRLETTDHLANLVGKSLVVADGRGSYRLLDTTRLYALGKLREEGEYPSTARLHAMHYRDFFADADSESESLPTEVWHSKYGSHIDDVRSSLEWSFSPDGDARIGVALTAAAIPLWVQSSLLSECRERAELALARLDESVPETARLRMRLSAALAWALMYGVGRARDAGPAWRTTLQLAKTLGDRDYVLRALWGLCIDQFNNGGFREALAYADEFAEAASESGSLVDRLMADRLRATNMHYLGDQKVAHRFISSTLAGLSDLTPRPQIARFRFDLRISAHYFYARILWLMGLADQSIAVVEANIQEGGESDNALTFCSVLGQAACPIAYLAGDLPAADHYGALLLEHTERHPIRLWNLWARAFRAMVVARRSSPNEGLALLRRALELAGDARFLPRFLLPLGELASLLGDAGEIESGLAYVADMLARCESREERWYQPEILRIKGDLFLKEGSESSLAEAERSFGAAIDLARIQGALFWELRAAMGFSRLMSVREDRSSAKQLLAATLAKFTEGFASSADLRNARLLLEKLSDG